MSPTDDKNDDAEPGGANERHAAVSFSDAVKSLGTLRAYLEATGCQDYSLLYRLADHVYDCNRQQSVQKSIKDYFSV